MKKKLYYFTLTPNKLEENKTISSNGKIYTNELIKYQQTMTGFNDKSPPIRLEYLMCNKFALFLKGTTSRRIILQQFTQPDH